MRMRKKKNLQPRMGRCRPCFVGAPDEMKGEWGKLMPKATAIHLELGCGKGRFTYETAAAHPDVLFVAIERVPDAMVIAMERVLEVGLGNVFFIDGDVDNLEEYFAGGEVDRIYINFCDPWPRNKHAARRLTHETYLNMYRKLLHEEGDIHFKTDNMDLFDFSLTQFPKAGFSLEKVSRNLHKDGIYGVMTDYEEKFYCQGMPIYRCVGVASKENSFKV